MKNVLMIGCGCLAKTMLELWKLEKIVIDKIILHAYILDEK